MIGFTTTTRATTSTTTTVIPTGARLRFSTPIIGGMYYDECQVLGQHLIDTTLTIRGQGNGYGDPYEVDLVGTWTGLRFRSGTALSPEDASTFGSGWHWDGGLDFGTYLTARLGYGRSPNGCDYTVTLEARGSTPWLSNSHPAALTFAQACPPGRICNGTCNCETYYTGRVGVTP